MRRGTFFGDFPVTSTILVLCIAMYGIEVYCEYRTDEKRDGEANLRQVVVNASPDDRLGVDIGQQVERGQVWRLVASAFLHIGVIHILMNMWVLVDLGRLCEPHLGRERFAAVYVACAIAGSLASAGWQLALGRHGGSAGASGALMGLIGLLLSFSIRHRDREMRDDILRWVIYIVLFSVLVPGIDHAGHIGGFVAGLAFGWFTPRYVSSGAARSWAIPFWAAVGVTAASLAYGVWNLAPWRL